MEEMLNCDTVDVRPRFMDWSAANERDYGVSESWESWASQECEGQEEDGPVKTTSRLCGAIVATGGTCEKCGTENDSDPSPMMNYFYPLAVPDYRAESFDPQEEAKKLAKLPLCLVKINGGEYAADEWGLALTGGGMDLSWEICAAYVALGYRPPAHFCRDLPEFAGDTLTKDRARVIRLCLESLQVQSDWNKRGRERLIALRVKLRAASVRAEVR